MHSCWQLDDFFSFWAHVNTKCTPSAIKRSQLIFVCNFVKNQQILMQFSLLGCKMNDTCEDMNFTHLT